jgi:hypothetical protein
VAPNSPVQDMALEILVVLDRKEQGQSRFDTVKGLVAIGDRARVKEQFPEYFDPFEDIRREDGTYDVEALDDAEVEWTTPTSPDEDADLARWIAQRESGSMTAADWEE